ncbi:unnamed protein product [Cylicocyclus nassatus]|uniref:Uncharacterized protein n=1 Tax=Cylicocyclus nassatus TaxID=53992 RepID=A0AA36H2F7_CYLNA|nr:unnamed protein product [Cylicocyclus nassatus]
MAHKGRRPTQKQQRELDAKMHETLRSLMFRQYERETSVRRSALLEAQRILAGKGDQLAVEPKKEPTSDDDLDLECDLELEQPVQIVEEQPAPSSSRAPAPRPRKPESRPRARRTGELAEPGPAPARVTRSSAVHNEVPRLEVTAQDDVELEEVSMVEPQDVSDEPLFDNQLTAEEKLRLSEGGVVAGALDIDIDVDTEVTLDQLKTLSLEEVCIRMAYCAHNALQGGDTRHSASWYKGLMKTCLEAVNTHEYPRPHLPFEVERIFDDYCHKIAEQKRAEDARNAVKLERRSIGCTTTLFECVYPVSTESMTSNKVLLTGVTGDAAAFFKLYLQNVHIRQGKQCYHDCICYSVSYRQPNVLHFAAAYGNAEFIKKVMFPEDALPHDQAIREHYKTMIEGWLLGAIEQGGTKMYPFDVAVFYNYKDCAREFLGSKDFAKALQDRKTEMTMPRSSLNYNEYIESPLSMAVYHGNSEMIKMLHNWQLIQPQHFPQAFREAANAGDVQMLTELYEMCRRNVTYIVEQDKERPMQTPLHVAAAAGHLRAVQYICTWGEFVRTKPDAVGDLPLTYAIENGHMAIADWLMHTYPNEINPTVIRSAVACKRNRLAKQIFDKLLHFDEIIDKIKPLNFAVEVENFHCAEYFLKQYMIAKKVNTAPWSEDVAQALHNVLQCRSLPADKKTKFVIAFQLAGVKISMVNIIKIVKDKSVAALICNSLRNSFNQPKVL